MLLGHDRCDGRHNKAVRVMVASTSMAFRNLEVDDSHRRQVGGPATWARKAPNAHAGLAEGKDEDACVEESCTLCCWDVDMTVGMTWLLGSQFN